MPRPAPSSPRRLALPACVLLASLAAATPAVAAPNIPLVEQPLAAPGGLPSIGNGVTAWTSFRDDAATKRPVFDVWTLRAGVPTRVATLPDTIDAVAGGGALREGAFDLEVGTASGVPVAVVRSPGTKKEYRRGLDRTVLVRLDTGATRRLPSKIDGLPVYGTAVDDGRLLFTVGRQKPTSKSTASLWRATVTPSRTGKPKKLRTSRRGSVWFSVLADQGRVAIDANEPAPGSYYENSYLFGTLRGTWRRAARIAVYDGAIPVHGVAGFTTGGTALVTFLSSDDSRDPVQVTRTPVAGKGGATAMVGIGTDGENTNAAGAFDPTTGRILTNGDGPDGTNVFGYSGVAFAPGS